MSDEKKGAPEWIVTFSDIVSLLVTFFILMLTWSTLEREDFDLISGSLQGALGVVGITTDKTTMIERRQMRLERSEHQGTETPAEEESGHNPYAALAIRLKEKLGEEVHFDRLRKGYRVRLRADALFAPSSAELTPACRAALGAVAEIVAGRSNPVCIEGHTDDRFAPSPAYATAWDLSTARAAAAARYLSEAGHVQPERLSVAGYAGLRPAVPNRSDAARARNRRIDIVILKTPSRPRGS